MDALIKFVTCQQGGSESPNEFRKRLEEQAKTVKALLDAGASREVVMKNGKTALGIAQLNKKAAVVGLLSSDIE